MQACRHSRPLLVVLLGILATFSLGQTPLYAFNLMRTGDGSVIHWPQSAMPIRWFINEQGSDNVTLEAAQAAFANAFTAWNDVPCSYSVAVYEGATSAGRSVSGTLNPNNINTLLFVESDWPSEWNNALGVAQPVFNPANGEVKDVDIFFNGVQFTWGAEAGAPATGRADLWNVATHEIGHLFGLDHPGQSGAVSDTEHPEATMYYASAVGEIARRFPALDDIQGLCAIYPEQGQNGMPCAGNGDCNSGHCKTDPDTNVSFCTSPCSATSTSCPSAFECDADAGYCVAKGGRLAKFGESCINGYPCSGNLWCAINSTSGVSMCTRDCPPDCPDGYLCQQFSGGKGGCWAKNTTGGILGQTCSAVKECRDPFTCLEIIGEGRRCVENCAKSCITGFDCLGLQGGSNVCWPSDLTKGEQGQPCTKDAQCASGVCGLSTVSGEGRRCTVVCADDSSCDAGLTCQTLSIKGTAAAACWPTDTTASPAAITSLTTTPASPSPPARVSVTCRASATHGARYQIWYLEPDGDFQLLSDFSANNTAEILLTSTGSHTLECRARDRFSADSFDDRAQVVFVVDPNAVLPDGDTDVDEETTPIGPGVNGGGGGCATGGVSLLLLAGVLGAWRRRRRV